MSSLHLAVKKRCSLAACKETAGPTCSSLTHAQPYMAVASVFRNFSFEIYETDITDIELAHDFCLPSPRLDSKGVRV